MALKDFNELRKIDVSAHVEKRDGFDYLNWAKCIDLLHQNGAKVVYFTPLTKENGSSLFMSDRVFQDKNGYTNSCYEVAVEIVIDDLCFIMRHPLMNGSNPVKDNSISQQRVWNAQTRAFVKGVAIRTGLGFDLWNKDFESDTSAEDDIYKHKIKAIKERTEQAYTRLIKKGYSTAEIAEKLGMTHDTVKAFFTYFDILDKFEKDLNAL